ncbi:MAG: FAD/NAD(P)-binding oxidoreductase [Ferruginibacter sp.]
MKHIIIIGNGVAGVTAARHIRMHSGEKITIISKESDYFFSRTALMYVYMGHMKFEHIQPYENNFWKDNGIQLKKGIVKSVDTKAKMLELEDGSKIVFDKLLIASGSKSNMFDWPGQNLKGVTGLYSKQDLETLHEYSDGCKRAVVVGGGLIGIELAEMFNSRNIPVTFLIREKSFWSTVLPSEESEMINRHIAEHGIDLLLETELKEIIADEKGRVTAVITNTGERISCEIVGLAAGVTPNIDFLKSSGIELDKGVLVNEFLETSVPDIYALGDCAQQRAAIGSRKTVEAVWYTGRMMGEVVAQTICGNKMPYNPGHWFNSAKFFDIEYQTYGWVWAKPKENESHFYWEHVDGKMAIRFAYDKNTQAFLGVNLFGIRMRHEFFDRVLTEKRNVAYVIENLASANFDPEFYKTYERDVQQAFTSKPVYA